jgi:hypothetical protein
MEAEQGELQDHRTHGGRQSPGLSRPTSLSSLELSTIPLLPALSLPSDAEGITKTSRRKGKGTQLSPYHVLGVANFTIIPSREGCDQPWLQGAMSLGQGVMCPWQGLRRG